MRVAKEGARCLVRCEVGEILPNVLLDLAAAQGWKSGSLTGLGGVKNVRLAYYDLQARRYLTFDVEGIVELVSLMGNLSHLEGKPMWHLHASVADRNGNVRGGHLVSLEVAITVECWITVSSLPVVRAADDFSGLNLLDL